MGAGTKTTVIAALVGNFVITLVKLAAGLLTRSASILAEAAHSASDTGNQVLLMIGLRQSAKGPSERHPFGSGKAAYFWPLMVAFLLFAVAGAYSVFQGVEKVLHPHEIRNVEWAFGVLGVSMVVEGSVLGVALRKASARAKAQGHKRVREFLAHNKDAILLTVIVEDSLALMGLFLAAVFLALAVTTGDARWDGMGSLLIGLLLMGFALYLARENRDLLLGEAMTPQDAARVRGVLDGRGDVEGVVALKSMHLSPDQVLLALEVEFRDDLTADDVEAAVVDLERALKQVVPTLKYVFIEPAARRGSAGG